MKSKFIKIGLSAAAFVTTCLPMTAMAAQDQPADNVVDGVGTIPVSLSVEATPIKASVPLSVDLVVAANSTNATTADNHLITNDASVGALEVTNVTAGTGSSGWTLVDKTEDFANMEKDAKKLYLGVGIGTDECASMVNAYTPTDNEIVAGGNKAMKFEAKTGIVSTALSNVESAAVVVTLAQK